MFRKKISLQLGKKLLDVPFYYQKAEESCIPASLAMLLNFYDIKVSEEELYPYFSPRDWNAKGAEVLEAPEVVLKVTRERGLKFKITLTMAPWIYRTVYPSPIDELKSRIERLKSRIRAIKMGYKLRFKDMKPIDIIRILNKDTPILLIDREHAVVVNGYEVYQGEYEPVVKFFTNDPLYNKNCTSGTHLQERYNGLSRLTESRECEGYMYLKKLNS